MTHVRYIDKTRDYYASEGYTAPYRWAHFDTIPFTPLAKPLAACRVGIVTTSELAVRGEPLDPDVDLRREVYSLPSDVPAARLVSRRSAYDRYATTLDDADAYVPVTRLAELAAEGRIAGVGPRIHCVFNEYSQRKTLEVDAPEILRRLTEDRVDVAILAAV